ncbi:MAG: sigma-70 family RNA polymerase sigma factor [Acidobacteriota bacterium]|nr:sigma-70 family RNA polymerase sigma factor [Acidobacteriota bacterium]
MTTPTSANVTQLLIDWRGGNNDALNQLMPLVYDELRGLAKRYLRRESASHTLQTNALVNEAYLRLVNQQNVDWQNRAHFFAIAAQVMRHLLVDHARSKQYAKRGGGAQQITLDEGLAISDGNQIELLSLHQALERLEQIDDRKSKIVELRYFGGLSTEETAEVLGVSEITIKREWAKAKAWLFRELSQSEVGLAE